MISKRYGTILCMLSMSVLSQLYVSAQGDTPKAPEAVSSHSVPLLLDISRRSLKNFLQDEAALERYLRPDGSLKDLEDAFTIGAVRGRYALIWDVTACRLVGVVDVKPPSEERPGVHWEHSVILAILVSGSLTVYLSFYTPMEAFRWRSAFGWKETAAS